jgi:hypothetical protein
MRTILLILLAALPFGTRPDGARLEKYAGEFAYGLNVLPPWADGGRFIVNLPEHLEYESRGMGILRYSDKEPRGHWEVGADGRSATLSVESPTAAGVRIDGVAKATRPDRIEITIRITNGGKIPLPTVKPLYCFHYRELAGFPQWVDNFKHTFVLHEGKPVALSDVPTKSAQAKVKGGTVTGCAQHDDGFAEKQGGLVESGVDAAITAVEALDGKRKVVVAWSPGKSFLSNSNIPCLHADPFYGTIEPGRSAEARGVVLFTEGPIEEAFAKLRGEGWGAPPASVEEGLAAKHPGDVGLQDDPAVLLFEDFEQEPKRAAWMKPGGWFDQEFKPGSGCEITDQVPAAAGKRCLQFNLKKGKTGSGGMFHLIKPVDTLYFRYYRMFEKDWEWPKGYGPHDGMIFGGTWDAPTKTDLSIYVDFWQTADTVARIATAKQKIGYDGWNDWLKKKGRLAPVGGNGFAWNKSKPDKIEPGKWHCVEVMVKLSAPGQEDGAVKLWVNGKLVSEYSDLPLRDADHPDLLLNMAFLAPYFHPGSGKDQTHWADQIVVATSYIGPVRKP